MSLTRLPDELLLMIVPHLDSADLAVLRATASRFDGVTAPLLFETMNFHLSYQSMERIVQLAMSVKLRCLVKTLSFRVRDIMLSFQDYDAWTSFWHELGDQRSWERFQKYEKIASFMPRFAGEMYHDLVAHGDILGNYTPESCYKKDSADRTDRYILSTPQLAIMAFPKVVRFEYHNNANYTGRYRLHWLEAGLVKRTHWPDEGPIREVATFDDAQVMENMFCQYILTCLAARPDVRLQSVLIDHPGYGMFTASQLRVWRGVTPWTQGSMHVPIPSLLLQEMFRHLTKLCILLSTGVPMGELEHERQRQVPYYDLTLLISCDQLTDVDLFIDVMPRDVLPNGDVTRKCLQDLSKPGTWPKLQSLDLRISTTVADLEVFLQTFSPSLRLLDLRGLRLLDDSPAIVDSRVRLHKQIFHLCSGLSRIKYFCHEKWTFAEQGRAEGFADLFP